MVNRYRPTSHTPSTTMSIVTPKLHYDRKLGTQVPVWEITDKRGRKLWYERVHRDGYRPIGCTSSTIQPDGGMINVVESVTKLGTRPDGREREIFVLKEEDGFEAPMSWYERLDGTKAQPAIPEVAGEETGQAGQAGQEGSDTQSVSDYYDSEPDYF